MLVLLVVSVIVLIGLVVALVLGRIGGQGPPLVEPTRTAGGWPLPETEVTSAALAAVRFDRCLRGYRMDQVDEVLDRLRARLAEYEQRWPAPGDSAPDRDGPGRGAQKPQSW